MLDFFLSPKHSLENYWFCSVPLIIISLPLPPLLNLQFSAPKTAGQITLGFYNI